MTDESEQVAPLCGWVDPGRHIEGACGLEEGHPNHQPWGSDPKCYEECRDLHHAYVRGITEPVGEKCECGAAKRERCVDCGADLHGDGGDCNNQHHEFEPVGENLEKVAPLCETCGHSVTHEHFNALGLRELDWCDECDHRRFHPFKQVALPQSVEEARRMIRAVYRRAGDGDAAVMRMAERDMDALIEAVRREDIAFYRDSGRRLMAELEAVRGERDDPMRQLVHNATLGWHEAVARAEAAERKASPDAALVEAARALLPLAECRCDEAYTARGRHESNVAHADFEVEFEELRAALAGLVPDAASAEAKP